MAKQTKLREKQSYFICVCEAAWRWISYLNSNFFIVLFHMYYNLFCVLRPHSAAADFSLQRPPAAESHLHPAVSSC